MRYSKLFAKTQRSVSSQFETKNHELLHKAGFIDQVGGGIYAFLPMGLKVLTHIEQVVRDEMNSIHAEEVLMPSLHPRHLWEQTDRWNNVDILFQYTQKNGQDYAFGPTHEEIVTPLGKLFIQSYKDLPKAVYQIQTKFRNEARAKSGLLRGREFRMKDLYSFHTDGEDLENYYTSIVIPAYKKVFERLGLDALLTEASGGIFSKFSHEFQVVIPSGEDTIYVCQKCGLAKNKEIWNPDELECTNCKNNNLDDWKESKASEVGNIFKLNDKFSKAFDFSYTAKNGEKQSVLMGCYGIGTSRLMGVIVEKFHDDKGIIWPENVAPYQVHLVGLDLQDEDVKKKAEDLYQILNTKYQIPVLYDDREDVRAGEKFADADLIGIPHRLVVSKKTGDKIEYKRRSESESKFISVDEIVTLCQKQ